MKKCLNSGIFALANFCGILGQQGQNATVDSWSRLQHVVPNLLHVLQKNAFRRPRLFYLQESAC